MIFYGTPHVLQVNYEETCGVRNLSEATHNQDPRRESYVDYLGNSIGLALAAVFVIPQIRQLRSAVDAAASPNRWVQYQLRSTFAGLHASLSSWAHCFQCSPGTYYKYTCLRSKFAPTARTPQSRES